MSARVLAESALRVSDCVTELLRKQPFFGSLVLRLPLRPDFSRETLATDGQEILYSPRWVVTCRLHEVDTYTYLVDVLQRISMHPANRAIELTPRMWKSLFADDPLQSDLGPHHHDPPPH